MADLFYDIYYRRLMELNNDHRLGRINAMHGTLSKIIDASDAKDLWKPPYPYLVSLMALGQLPLMGGCERA
ncbi:hypothetical protein [Vulcanisaeta distributa]|uniref:hypothetical protein n=1 Tax=Vulcanisaeta distributa TaxID=164451 RepID=UPI000AD79F54|nr:hypothetical protein [Vulcanisaeta distributa]